MLVDTDAEYISIQHIESRRFMFSPSTGELILGRQYRDSRLRESHAAEYADSGAKATFDDFIRGWLGTSKIYSKGIIHFAPAIKENCMLLFERGFTTLEMFWENGAVGETVIRGFGNRWEQPLSALLETTSVDRIMPQQRQP